MTVWLVYGTARNDPDARAYLLGAYSSRDAALKQRAALAASYAAHVVEIAVDRPQPPVLIGKMAVTAADPCVSDRLGDQD